KPFILGATDRSLAISPNGTLLAVGTRDGTLRLIGAESGHTLALAQLPASIEVVAFGPDDTVLALLQSQNLLYIFSNDLKTHSERLVQAHPRDVIWSQALGAAIVVAGGADDIHPSLQFFPAQPLGIANSTSTSPLWMIGVNESARRAYTTGALTFPEIDLAQNRIARTFELPTRSAAIVLSPDRNTAYVTYQDANKIGVINLQDMKTYRE